MTATSEDWICKRAYELWDKAGRPDGRSEEFWFAAKAELERRELKAERKPRSPEPLLADPRRRETAADRPNREPASQL